ncbi:MAG: hypothetical protein AAF941_06075 [Pseudomonadota bacterium]
MSDAPVGELFVDTHRCTIGGSQGDRETSDIKDGDAKRASCVQPADGWFGLSSPEISREVTLSIGWISTRCACSTFADAA